MYSNLDLTSNSGSGTSRMVVFTLQLFLVVASSHLQAQINDFPISESTKKISFTEQFQNLDYPADQLSDEVKKWYEAYYSDPQNTLYNVSQTDGRIFIDAYSVFWVHSLEEGARKDYLIRLNYNLRFFIHDGDLRYELTNIIFGTTTKIKLITAEQFFDESHLNLNLATAESLEEKENIVDSYQQYKLHTLIIIDQLIEGIARSLY